MDELRKALSDRLGGIEARAAAVAGRLRLLHRELRRASGRYVRLKELGAEITEAMKTVR